MPPLQRTTPTPTPTQTLDRQVCVAVLLDNFVNASARDEERARLRKIEEAKSYKVGEEEGGGSFLAPSWTGDKADVERRML